MAARWTALTAAHAADSRRLAARLRVGLAQAAPRLQAGHFTSGSRLDCGRWAQGRLQRRATGAGEARVFRRTRRHAQPAVGFVLCCDHSGSMAGGGRIEALQATVVTVSRAVAQLAVPLGIIAYSDHVTPLKAPDAAVLDGGQLLEALTPSGSNNEVAALEAAEAMLEAAQLRRAFVIFVTDGGAHPDIGARAAALQRRRPGLEVVGVGVGDGAAAAAQLARAYPRCLPAGAAATLPSRLGHLLATLQRRGRAPAQRA